LQALQAQAAVEVEPLVRLDSLVALVAAAERDLHLEDLVPLDKEIVVEAVEIMEVSHLEVVVEVELQQQVLQEEHLVMVVVEQLVPLLAHL
jgi:hypothetical protein